MVTPLATVGLVGLRSRFCAERGQSEVGAAKVRKHANRIIRLMQFPWE
jgi:hypothetical protein